MASISYEKRTGRRTVQFVGKDGGRRSIRLGKVSKTQAKSAKEFIEDLVACTWTGRAPGAATSEWVAGLPDVIRRRIEAVRLIEPQERHDCPTLGEWLAAYVGGRRDVKRATATVYGHTRRNLLAFFGADKPLDAITPGDADAFRVHLTSAEKLADNTVRRRMGIAKQFFRAAVRRKLIADNPFDGQATVVRQNPKRMHFVSREDAQAVLDALPDAQWRLVFALSRYGGLRCPSEVERLKWEDVSWDRMRFTVHARKTEHHADAGIRVVPIFPELYPYLLDAFEAAPDGAVFCCPQFANAAQMYRKAIMAALKRAGVKPWAKLFQNCRASRETELAERFPVQVVCAWIGNSPQVAAKHYLQVTDDHFAKAVHFPVQCAAEMDRDASHTVPGRKAESSTGGETPKNKAPREGAEPYLLGRTGLEPVTSCVSSRSAHFCNS